MLCIPNLPTGIIYRSVRGFEKTVQGRSILYILFKRNLGRLDEEGDKSAWSVLIIVPIMHTVPYHSCK